MTEPRWKVLIIDDNRAAGMDLAMRVSDLGFVVTLANSGEQGLKAARAMRPHIVFVDMVLPDMEGAEVMRFEAHLGKPVRPEEIKELLKGEGLKA